jgi:hypothetical protein
MMRNSLWIFATIILDGLAGLSGGLLSEGWLLRHQAALLACPGSELPEPAAPYSATASSIRNVVGGRVPPALSDSRSASLEFSNSDKIAALMYPNTGVADCQEAKHRANGECESTSIRGHGGGSTRP